MPEPVPLGKLAAAPSPFSPLLRLLQRLLDWLLGRPRPGGKPPYSARQAAAVPAHWQAMLRNLQCLDQATVGDVMVPRGEVHGIDIEEPMDRILEQIVNSPHTRLPVYKKDLNNIIGILHMRRAARLLTLERVNRAELLQLTREAWYVPESTPLHAQLLKFQKTRKRLALVVDEYGDVQGIVTLDDILEEILGGFGPELHDQGDYIRPREDGSFLIDGATPIREINRALGWNLPTEGPRTLNGLLTEALESIPDTPVGLRLPGYCAEILQVKDTKIKTVRMWPGHGRPLLLSSSHAWPFSPP